MIRLRKHLNSRGKFKRLSPTEWTFLADNGTSYLVANSRAIYVTDFCHYDIKAVYSAHDKNIIKLTQVKECESQLVDDLPDFGMAI